MNACQWILWMNLNFRLPLVNIRGSDSLTWVWLIRGSKGGEANEQTYGRTNGRMDLDGRDM